MATWPHAPAYPRAVCQRRTPAARAAPVGSTPVRRAAWLPSRRGLSLGGFRFRLIGGGRPAEGDLPRGHVHRLDNQGDLLADLLLRLGNVRRVDDVPEQPRGLVPGVEAAASRGIGSDEGFDSVTGFQGS